MVPPFEHATSHPKNVRPKRRPKRSDFLEKSGQIFWNLHLARYVQGILGVQAVLDVGDHHEFLDDLAHTTQVFLIGLWLFNTPDSKGRKLAEDAAANILQFFSACKSVLPEMGHLHRRIQESHSGELGLLRTEPLAPDDAIPEDVLDDLHLCWGICAAMHDIGLPVQRFDRWGRQFFSRFFDHGAQGWLRSAPSRLAEIFLHPRFPVYKNAIVGLHGDRHVRDWLDALFCRQLTGG